MQEAIIWLLLIEIIGLVGLPLALTVFRFLPDQGYTLAKPLGLLGLGYVVWLLTMLGLPFNSLVCWLIFAIGFIALDGWLLARQKGQLLDQMRDFFRRHIWLIVVGELLFIAAYAYLVYVRSFMPEIRDQEKFGDFAFLNSMVLYDKMPPADPWMSGYPVNYYYFSHFTMAMLVKMVGLNPAIAFNLTVPIILAITGLACFGLVYNLVGVVGRKTEGGRRKAEDGRRDSALSPQSSVLSPAFPPTPGIAFGLLATVMVCLLGNLDPVRQLLAPRAKEFEYGLEGTANGFVFNWWSPSRVIWDYMPQPTGNGGFIYQWSQTINEFPMFSFLLSDMHPHVMALPTVLLSISLALGLLLQPAGLGRTERGLFFGVTALAIGALYFLNTWDYPTYLILIALAALARERWWSGTEIISEKSEGNRWRAALRLALLGGALPSALKPFWGHAIRWLGFVGRLVVISLALFLPFHLTFISLIGDNPVPEPIASIPLLGALGRLVSFVAWDRTPLLGYLLVFGIFIFPMLSFLILKLWPYLKAPYAYLDDENYQSRRAPEGLGFYLTAGGVILLFLSAICFFILHLEPVLTIAMGLLALPFAALGVALFAAELLESFRPDRPQTELLAATGAAALLMILGGWMLHFELYGPLLIAAISISLLLWLEAKPGDPANATNEVASSQALRLADLFVLLLILLPVVITFFTELIIIRDVFNSRLNTLFKFYYQAWVMYGLAAAYAGWRVSSWAFAGVGAHGSGGGESEVRSQGSGSRNQLPALSNPESVPAFGFQPSALLRPATLTPAYQMAMSPTLSPIPPPSTYGGYTFTPDDDPEAEEAEEYEMGQPRRPWWRWLWVLAFGLLVMAGLIYPIFAPYEKTGHFARQVGLDGSTWLRDGGLTGGPMPEDFEAIQWLKAQLAADRSFSGPILETSGPDWVDYSRVSTFSGLPTLMGWPGHENQWRGGKAFARSDSFDCGQLLLKYNLRPALPGQEQGRSLQKDEPWCRVQLVDLLYNLPDPKLTENLLREAGVRYVYVGTLETGVNNGRSGQPKLYPPQSLAKFAQFMKPIYQRNGVTIYSF